MTESGKGVRLQRLIAQAGICSRRKAEEMIAAGRVKLNGKVVTEAGVRADPERDRVAVDGRQIQFEKKVYYLVYKPVGYICSRDDEAGRPVVFDLVTEERRLVSAGRLDYHSEGALLLTNDGPLVNGLTHPSRLVPKEYEVKVKGALTPKQIECIEQGVLLDDGPAKPIMVDLLRRTELHTWYLFIMGEGRNREVRRIVEAVGGDVLKLKRISFAGLRVDDMREGDVRKLSISEILNLYEIAGLVDEGVTGGEARKRLEQDLAERIGEKEADTKIVRPVERVRKNPRTRRGHHTPNTGNETARAEIPEGGAETIRAPRRTAKPLGRRGGRPGPASAKNEERDGRDAKDFRRKPKRPGSRRGTMPVESTKRPGDKKLDKRRRKQ